VGALNTLVSCGDVGYDSDFGCGGWGEKLLVRLEDGGGGETVPSTQVWGKKERMGEKIGLSRSTL